MCIKWKCLYIRIIRSITCITSNRLPHEIAHGSLRLTLGDESTEEDVDYVLEVCTTNNRKIKKYVTIMG